MRGRREKRGRKRNGNRKRSGRRRSGRGRSGANWRKRPNRGMRRKTQIAMKA